MMSEKGYHAAMVGVACFVVVALGAISWFVWEAFAGYFRTI